MLWVPSVIDWVAALFNTAFGVLVSGHLIMIENFLAYPVETEILANVSVVLSIAEAEPRAGVTGSKKIINFVAHAMRNNNKHEKNENSVK